MDKYKLMVAIKNRYIEQLEKELEEAKEKNDDLVKQNFELIHKGVELESRLTRHL
jgi:hypothetical protein